MLVLSDEKCIVTNKLPSKHPFKQITPATKTTISIVSKMQFKIK